MLIEDFTFYIKEIIMAKVKSQTVKKGALKILEQNGVDVKRFTPNIIAQVPIMGTALLATVKPKYIGWDQYNNPYIVSKSDERIALAAVIVCGNKIFVFNRENKELQNLNEKLDVVGAVGFGISSGPFKWPNEINNSKVTSVKFSDYYALEITDGDGDKEKVIMPIVVVNIDSMDGIEQHFINIPKENEVFTAKLNAALRELNK